MAPPIVNISTSQNSCSMAREYTYRYEALLFIAFGIDPTEKMKPRAPLST
jgi:hypothetical protein